MTQACGIKIEFQIGRTCVWFFFFFIYTQRKVVPEQACTCDSVLSDTHYTVAQSYEVIQWGDAFRFRYFT